MFCSKEDAQLLLAKWKNESASIVLFAQLPASRIVLTGTIYDVSDGEIQFVCKTGSQVSINMNEVNFTYGDPRERTQIKDSSEKPSFRSYLYLATNNEDVAYALFEASEEHLKQFLDQST
jgi:hypothetical protein